MIKEKMLPAPFFPPQPPSVASLASLYFPHSWFSSLLFLPTKHLNDLIVPTEDRASPSLLILI